LPERASPHDAFAGAVDTSVAVLAALGRLDAKSRAVLVMRFFDDLSEADTAAALGISPGTVKSRTSRALARLREMDVWEGMGR
jgi:RNA polymerase sigma factor (sigma-70 family)